MEHLAERLRLANISAIYSSDLKRAVKGAQIIARHHDVPLHALPELRELYFGDWEGMTYKEILERYPGELEKRKADPVNYPAPGGGESILQLSKRIMTSLRDILDDQKGKDFLLVVHGGVNRVILCNALDFDLAKMNRNHQDYGCLNIIDYLPDSILIRLING
jgi:alpha-ribazole phosphatase/probable phosphoglycerate mutase